MSMMKRITVAKAWMNNLQGVQLELTMGQFVVFVGPSGSGKSSLAFDVLYSEADRLGKARGLHQVFRRQEPRYEVSGLPEQTIGIEQQLVEKTMFETAGWGSGFLWQAHRYATVEEAGEKACRRCGGRGFVRDIDKGRLVRDPLKSVTHGAFTPAVKAAAGLDARKWERFCEAEGIAPATPWEQLPAAMKTRILEKDSDGGFQGLLSALRDFLLSGSPPVPKALVEEFDFYLTNTLCPVCDGYGFPDNGKATVGTKDTLGSLVKRGLVVLAGKEQRWFEELGLPDIPVRHPLFQMSSSEARRLRFFTCLRGLNQPSLVIFDEPAAGLLSFEARRLGELFRSISASGHAVLVIDHTEEIIRAAERVIEFGPGAGVLGGKVVNICTPIDFFKHHPKLSGQKGGPSPADPGPKALRQEGRRRGTPRNVPDQRLQSEFSTWCGFGDFQVDIPLGKLVCICGPSGSGKSVYLRAALSTCDKTPHGWQGRATLRERKGCDKMRRSYLITPEAIGKHSGSTPATYIGLWDKIRDCYADLPEAKRARLKKSHFSFNTTDGRCPKCLGNGYLPLGEEHFLECPECRGQRFRMDRVAKVRHHGRDIAEANQLTVSEARQFFSRETSITHYLEFLSDTALDYLVLGQPSNTLSGGEAQRIKVAANLCKRLGDRSVYILDNPFRGIGVQAIPRLYEALRKLVSKNNTVIIAENHDWVASRADWVVILGRPGMSKGQRRQNFLYQGPPTASLEKLWHHEAKIGFGMV